MNCAENWVNDGEFCQFRLFFDCTTQQQQHCWNEVTIASLHGFLTRLLFSVVLLWEVRWTWWLLVAVFRRRAAAPYVYRGNHRTAFNHMRVYIMLLSDNMGIQYQLELVDLHTIQRIGSMWRPNNSTNGPPNQLFFLLFDKSRRRTNDI